MKKIIVFILSILFTSCLPGCGSKEPIEYEDEAKKWDCTVLCAEESEDTYVIAYSNEKVISDTGILSVQNRNSFDIVVHLLADNQEERTTEIMAGGCSVFYEISKDIEYSVGCHANVEEGTEIKLMVYDGEETEPYSIEQILKDKTEWSLQEIESLFLDNAEPEWKLIKCVRVYDFAYDRVGAVLYTTENDTEFVNIAFMDEEGIMPQCGIEAFLDENTEFTYHGNGEVTFNVCSKDGVKYKQKIVFSKHDDEVNFVSESMEY